jgi:hypothetical protein
MQELARYFIKVIAEDDLISVWWDEFMRSKTLPHPYAVLCHVSGLEWVGCLWEINSSCPVGGVEFCRRRPATWKEIFANAPVKAVVGCVVVIHARSCIHQSIRAIHTRSDFEG